MKKVDLVLDINAPLDLVWDVLISIDDYHKWNPFIPKVDCSATKVELGAYMDLHVQWSNGRKEIAREQVCTLDAPGHNGGAALWEYEYKGLLSALYLIRARRTQALKPNESGGTTYYSADVFRGPAIFLVPVEQVEKGFLLQAEALKKYCESKSTNF